MAIINARNTKALSDALNAYPKGFHVGQASLTAVDADLIAANIRLGITVFGVLGTLVQWVYDLKGPELPGLAIPQPACVLTAVGGVDATGPHDVPLTLTVPAPTIAVPTLDLYAALAVDGGVAHKQTGPVDTDETALCNSAAANDFHLLPDAGLASGDGFYLGLATKWNWLAINQGTAGVGTWTLSIKYWNGAWVALPGLYNDEITPANLKTTGIKRCQFPAPGDWAVSTIAGIADLYWIKLEIAYTSMATQPLGTQAWIGQY